MQKNSFKSFLSSIYDYAKRLAGINLLWFLYSLPVALLAIPILFPDNTSLPGNSFLIAIAIVTPFVLFPATVAMFAVLRKNVMGEEIPVISSYWNYYKENYVRSMLGGMLFVPIWCLLIFGYMQMVNNRLLDILFAVVALLLFIITVHYFSMTVHMETSFYAAIKSAVVITIGSPVLTVALGIGSAFILHIIYNIIPLLIPFFGGAIVAYLSFAGFFKVMLSVQIIRENEEETQTS